MPIYFYTAKTQNGENETGTIEANDDHNLAQILREKNLILTSFQIPEEKKIKKTPLLNKIRSILNRV
jgi:type II secretory pathway component PulF